MVSGESTDKDEGQLQTHGLKRTITDHLQTLPLAKHPHLAEEVSVFTYGFTLLINMADPLQGISHECACCLHRTMY